MATFDWKITSLTYNTAPADAAGGVIVAYWECVAFENGITESLFGCVSFTPDTSLDSYIPYQDLTESQVLNWCWASKTDPETGVVYESDVSQEKIEEALEAKFLKRSSVSVGMPWLSS